MTRTFRDEWEASNHDSSQNDDDAPPSVQDDVAALLRGSARREDEAVRMPDDVAARMRATLEAEFGSSTLHSERPAAPATIMPLPTRHDEARASSTPAARSTQRPTPVHEAPVGVAHPEITTDGAHRADSEAPAGVTSLDAHRRRRSSRLTKGAIALGAAAAVAVGAVTISQSLGHHDDAPVAARSASPDPAAKNFASRVRVTQTRTPYTAQRLGTQAALLPASKSTPIEPVQANAQALGPLATSEGIHSCLDALGSTMAQDPDKVYADFATYDGAPAVVVVTVKDGTKTAWVVSRTCSRASDLEAGPTTLAT